MRTATDVLERLRQVLDGLEDEMPECGFMLVGSIPYDEGSGVVFVTNLDDDSVESIAEDILCEELDEVHVKTHKYDA